MEEAIATFEKEYVSDTDDGPTMEDEDDNPKMSEKAQNIAGDGKKENTEPNRMAQWATAMRGNPKPLVRSPQATDAPRRITRQRTDTAPQRHSW